MSSLTPVFDGAYNGSMIYSAINYGVPEFMQYIESQSMVYSSMYDKQTTGFGDSVYLLSSVTSTNILAEIQIDLVGDLPFEIMQNFIQLSKACLGGGMSLIFEDNIITDNMYYCKWVDAGDFVENSEVYGGGSIHLMVYSIVVIPELYCYDTDGGILMYNGENVLMLG